MFGNQVSDKELSKTIHKKLLRASAPTKVLANVSRGTVTLTGMLKYEAQRKQLIKVVRAVAGVQHVMDQLQSPPKASAAHD